MADSLEPLDPLWVEDILSNPPFVAISGVMNVRSLGSYATRTPNTTTRENFLFRSAELSGITQEGRAQLKALGITKVYDLRSDTEIEKYNAPLPVIEGVDVIHIPVFKKEDYSPEVMARRYQLYASATIEAFMELYLQILEHGGPAFSVILKHIRDHPTEGCIFHCTAGKDRTGVIAAILLSLAGVDDDTIARDYELTRVGREPMREKIMARLAKEPIFAENKDAAMNMFSSRHETMIAFLNMLREKYGSSENYIKQHTDLSDDDIRIIRNNLVVSARL
ncbi:hypothetical protein BD410DRAFT_758941 [Rickenella mellea]|uniref:Tyrosine specific protein phosphatases domain-containing protein n=1 Tax=Rickenella mellea TaxID=50990 RepID=A0A4R5XGB1_9AGAM|nr:hypothetical protein BD410DRAFT_758941 [Rickenella mellea]